MAEGRAAPRPVPGFPELADVAVTWAPTPGGDPEQSMGHAAGSWRPLIPCDNPACRGGGFDLVPVVERMVSYRETERAGILVCAGWEGEAPRGAAEGTPCVRTIRYRLTLAYGGPPAPGPAGPPAPPGAPTAPRP